MRLRGEMIMDRLLIIDGSNLLFQMFFGMPIAAAVCPA